MRKEIKKILSATLAISAMVGCLIVAPVSAISNDPCSSSLPQAVRQANGCPGTGGNENSLPKIITSILSGIIAAAGLVAVIYIIVGGVQYMTSGGDAQKIEKAKKTILYAVIGLVVCALSFAIVNFVVLGLLK